MSDKVIEFYVDFCNRRSTRAPHVPPTELDRPFDIAAWIHDLIIDGLNSGEFLDCEEGPYAALGQFLQDRYGGDLAATAEGCFEVIYGCDPYIFLMRAILRGSSSSVRQD